VRRNTFTAAYVATLKGQGALFVDDEGLFPDRYGSARAAEITTAATKVSA
jgi:hypothetical protein